LTKPEGASARRPRARRVQALTAEQIGRRDRILAIARDLLTARGVAGVTMRELAQLSGVTLKTLYDIYGSKDALLVAAVRDRAYSVFSTREEAAHGLKGVPRLLYYVDLHSNGVRATTAFSRVVAPLLAGPGDRFGARELYARFHGRALEDIREAGELKPGVDPSRILEALNVTLDALLIVWAKDQISTDELFELNRLTVAQMVLPVVTGESAKAAMAAIGQFHARAM
jgi:AcrR family transcriptional regulator